MGGWGPWQLSHTNNCLPHPRELREQGRGRGRGVGVGEGRVRVRCGWWWCRRAGQRLGDSVVTFHTCVVGKTSRRGGIQAASRRTATKTVLMDGESTRAIAAIYRWLGGTVRRDGRWSKLFFTL